VTVLAKLGKPPDCDDCDCPDIGTVAAGCCPDPLPPTLYLHDTNGPHALIYEAGLNPATATWRSACFLVSVEHGAKLRGTGPEYDHDVPASVPMRWTLTCAQVSGTETFQWNLFAEYLQHPGTRWDRVDTSYAYPLEGACADLDTITDFRYGTQGRSSNECVTCVPLGLQFGFLGTGNAVTGNALQLLLELDPAFLVPFDSTTVYTFSVFVTGSTTPPAVAVNVCITARTCLPPDGAVIPGADVVLRDSSGTSVGTGTTDSDGRVCLPVTRAGTYQAAVTFPDGSTGTFPAPVGICGGNIEVAAIGCRGAVRVTVVDAAGNAPIEGAAVSGLDALSKSTDANGQITLTATTEQMLPLATISDTDCATRLVPIHIAAVNYLSQCLTVPIRCGTTVAAPTEDPEDTVALPSLDEDSDGQADFLAVPAACTDLGCEQRSYALRGLVGRRLAVAAKASVLAANGTWYPILGPLEAGTTLFLIDVAAAGGSIPLLVWNWSGPGIWTPPVELTGTTCSGSFQFYSAELNVNGLIVRASGSGSDSYSTPTAGVHCPETVSLWTTSLAFTFAPCLDEWPWSADSGEVVVPGGAGGRDLKYRVQVTVS
jgi:hypothetical protein